uniref:Uncharacterized protein n=1 Tax=Nelumbo nucifera TaxID=4432 RepID=A0A822YLS6_NELNU|nr:TPA_asm: hypothetical protein HUJ06_012391 [Nelumbo nucifera]
MALMISYLHILTLISLFNPLVQTVNFSYPAVFNFGDSNSDTGGLAAAIAFPVNSPNGQTYFLKPSGRFCDGRLIVDFLVDAMDLPLLNAYLDSVGAPNFGTGCNFATGGSTILPANAASTSPFSFGIQVAQFLRFKARVLELLAKGKGLEKFLPPEDYFKKGLYMFDIGQNDLDGAFYSTSEDQVLALIPTILQEFESGVKKAAITVLGCECHLRGRLLHQTQPHFKFFSVWICTLHNSLLWVWRATLELRQSDLMWPNKELKWDISHVKTMQRYQRICKLGWEPLHGGCKSSHFITNTHRKIF